MYLSAETVEQTLLFAATNSCPGSGIIFDVTSPEVIQGTEDRPEAAAWRQKASESGEPLCFGIHQEDLRCFLDRIGFSKITFVGHEYFNRHYFKAEGDARAATPILRVVHARIEK